MRFAIALAALLGIAVPLAAAARPSVPAWVTAVLPSGASFGLEVAADDETRARGYMFRESVGPREGMLFWYPASGRYGFWMKNCLVSLDIVWLDGSWRVVHVLENAQPCPARGPCPPLEPPVEARYVIEFAAGTAASHGLRPGSTVVVLSETPVP